VQTEEPVKVGYLSPLPEPGPAAGDGHRRERGGAMALEVGTRVGWTT
jgi:hypothetical protein